MRPCYWPPRGHPDPSEKQRFSKPLPRCHELFHYMVLWLSGAAVDTSLDTKRPRIGRISALDAASETPLHFPYIYG